MAYALLDVDLTRPLPPVTLTECQTGIAVLGRAADRPVHFSLHPLPAGARLDGDALRALLGAAATADLEATRLRDGLAPPPVAPPVDVTVAVCTHERPEDLADGLRALRATGARVLVVDNAPRTEATRRVALDAGVEYLQEPRAGLDFARNAALRAARTPWVAFVDDDARVDAGWLAGLQEAVAENPDAALVTGLVLPAELVTRAQILFEARGGFRRGLGKLRYHGPVLPGNPLYPLGAGMFGAGANMVVRRELLLALGGFDEALDTGRPLPGGGDLDAFQRVLHAGHPLVYEPRMLVFHRHRRGYGELRRQYRSWGAGFMAYVGKTYRAQPESRVALRGLLAWWAAYAVRELALALRTPGGHPPDLALAELTGGVGGLLGDAYGRSRRRVQAARA